MMFTAWMRFSARLAKNREANRDRPPHHGEPPRSAHVVYHRPGGPPGADTDRPSSWRRGALQLGGLRRERGIEERGDEQADQPVREVVEDEGDEHVIGVRGLGPGGKHFEGRLRLGSYGLAPFMRGQGTRPAPRLGRGVAVFPGGEPVHDGAMPPRRAARRTAAGGRAGAGHRRAPRSAPTRPD